VTHLLVRLYKQDVDGIEAAVSRGFATEPDWETAKVTIANRFEGFWRQKGLHPRCDAGRRQ
jgi:hypothetical protein